MSMHSYPIGGYGLYLDSDEAAAFVMAYSDKYSDGQYDEVDVMGNVDGERLDADEPIDGWGVRLLYGNEHFSGEYATGIFLYGPRKGSCLASDRANLYKDADEMAGELFSEYGECLPKDFDYRAHLAEFSGTVMG